MDIREQKATWQLFVSLTKWSTIITVAILVLMAITLV